ncbi:PEGA domain protein [Phycisphaerae bacterium RAS1]|nr:PEGA domain protein [Phycisphaerae bacterium RAS1]
MVAAITLGGVCGCVERIMKVETEPPGATVLINDEEVGLSPVKFSFTWYGDYDIIVRKKGYETLKTHYKVDAPWYQWPPIDFFAELLTPGTIRDERSVPRLTLAPASQPAVADVVDRAVELRDEAIYGDRP